MCPFIHHSSGKQRTSPFCGHTLSTQVFQESSQQQQGARIDCSDVGGEFAKDDPSVPAGNPFSAHAPPTDYTAVNKLKMNPLLPL